MYWVLLRQNRLYTKSALKTTLSEVSCLAPGFDIKLSDDDTECNHFSLLYKHTNCVCVCVFVVFLICHAGTGSACMRENIIFFAVG